jgi:hypothetical protein
VFSTARAVAVSTDPYAQWKQFRCRNVVWAKWQTTIASYTQRRQRIRSQCHDRYPVIHARVVMATIYPYRVANIITGTKRTVQQPTIITNSATTPPSRVSAITFSITYTYLLTYLLQGVIHVHARTINEPHALSSRNVCRFPAYLCTDAGHRWPDLGLCVTRTIIDSDYNWLRIRVLLFLYFYYDFSVNVCCD